MDLQLVNEVYDNALSDIGYLWREARPFSTKMSAKPKLPSLTMEPASGYRQGPEARP